MSQPVMLFVAPHLSTGGLPQYLVWQVQRAMLTHEVHLAEWVDVTGGKFVVQRKRLQALVGDRFHSLDKDGAALLSLIDRLQPTIVHFAEVAEADIPLDILASVFAPEATYEIYETSHSADAKFFEMVRFLPAKFVLVSPLQVERFARLGVPCELLEYTPEHRERPNREEALRKLGLDPAVKHVLNVGLFTPGKNQAEVMAVARRFTAEPVHFHFVGNLAPNFGDYWRPLLTTRPRNCTVWGERDDVDDFYAAMDVMLFTSTLECNPLVVKEAAAWGMPVMLYELPTYLGMQFDPLVEFLDASREQNSTRLRQLLGLPTPSPETYRLIPLVAAPDKVEVSFGGGPRASINGISDERYDVKFVDSATNKTPYACPLSTGQWALSTTRYYVAWDVQCYKVSTGELFHAERLDLYGKRVYISIESKALGDTIAWFPYAEEFRRKHQCQLVVSTFWNELFRYTYPHIQFVEPGKAVHNIYAQYQVGWFWGADNRPDPAYHPVEFRNQPLQKTATDILGLPFTEVRAKLAFNQAHASPPTDFVGIGVQSTMQLKYWNHPTGWQELVDWFRAEGKTVLSLSREVNGYMGNHYPEGTERLRNYTIERVVAAMSTLEVYVGTNSGLSWAAWALGVPTVVVEGATPDITMPSDVTRVHPDSSVCRDCFLRTRFDAGVWDWCPDHGEDAHKFECTSVITSAQVIAGVRSQQRRARTANIKMHEGLRTTDEGVVDEVFWNDAYELAKLKGLGLAPKVTVDIGGHIGSYGMKVREVWPAARIIAFDPNTESCQLYRLNVPEATVIAKGVTYEDCGVLVTNTTGSTLGGAVLVRSVSDIDILDASHLPHEGQWRVVEHHAERTTLEDILAQYAIDHIDLLKMDCEGGEYSILEGMSPDTASRIGLMVGEYHAVHGNGLEDFRQALSRRFPHWVLRVVTSSVAPLPSADIGTFLAGPEALVRATCTS